MIRVKISDISSSRLPISNFVSIEGSGFDCLNDFMEEAIKSDSFCGEEHILTPSKISDYSLDFDYLISQVEPSWRTRFSEFGAVTDINVFNVNDGSNNTCVFRWAYRKVSSYFYHACYREP